MKRQLFKALAIIVSAFLLVGCTPRLNNPETNYDVNLDVVSNYEVEGTLKVGITSIYTERWLIDALIEEYNQVYPNQGRRSAGCLQQYVGRVLAG